MNSAFQGKTIIQLRTDDLDEKMDFILKLKQQNDFLAEESEKECLRIIEFFFLVLMHAGKAS